MPSHVAGPWRQHSRYGFTFIRGGERSPPPVGTRGSWRAPRHRLMRANCSGGRPPQVTGASLSWSSGLWDGRACQPFERSPSLAPLLPLLVCDRSIGRDLESGAVRNGAELEASASAPLAGAPTRSSKMVNGSRRAASPGLGGPQVERRGRCTGRAVHDPCCARATGCRSGRMGSAASRGARARARKIAAPSSDRRDRPTSDRPRRPGATRRPGTGCRGWSSTP